MKPMVLIAEDDRILTKMLETKLNKFEAYFDITFATDGKEAIDVLKKQSVALLVTDIQMPNIDGFRLLGYMSEHHPVVPCLVMSSHNPQETRSQVSEDSVHFFPKPVDAEVLGRAIHQVVSRDIPRGALFGISVVSFLKMIAMEKKTCLFDIVRPDGKKGRFYFHQGTLFDAVCGDLKNEAAAMALISLKQATFRFKYVPKKKIPRRIMMDLPDLIIEAKRREMGLTPMKMTG